MKKYYVYIITNKRNTVLYTGVTNDIFRRAWEHKSMIYKSFTAKYKVNKLVYYIEYDRIEDAIYREKQIKNLLRRKKIALIEEMNPRWKNLMEDINPFDD